MGRFVGLILCTYSFSLFAADTVPLAPPSLCATYAKQIFEDVTRYSNGVKDRSLSWKNIDSLRSIIGPGQANITVKNTYQWDNYRVQTENGKIVSQGGTLSDKVLPQNATLEQILVVLGQPNNIVTVKNTQYNWKCPDNGSVITMLAGEQNQLLQVEVTQCPMPSEKPADNTTNTMVGCSTAGAILANVSNDMPLPP